MLDLGFIEEQTEPFRCFKIKENGKIFMNLMKKNGADIKNGADVKNGADIKNRYDIQNREETA